MAAVTHPVPRSRQRRRQPVLGFALAAGVAAATALPAQETLHVPEEDVGVATLEARREAQRAAAADLGVPHDFRFADRREASGITFTHRIVEDAARHWKPVHYDHGNGVAVADVDGDGRLDLYFTTQVGGNELWRNLGDGRFENTTARAGVGLDERISVAASFGDVDNDGDPDLFVTTVRMGNVLFENRGDGRFRDVSAEAGVDYSGHSSGAVFLDYDRDGLLDLLVVNVGRYTTDRKGKGGYYIGLPDAFFGHLKPERAERSILYRNLGQNRFADVSQEVGLVDESWSGDATFTDLDRDGYPELYVLSMQGDDHYWADRDGKGFVDRTADLFPKTPWGAMGVDFFDYDNDGDLDLFVTDMHSDMAEEVGPDRETKKSTPPNPEEHYSDAENNILGNAFYENLGEGRFRERSDELGLENYWPWGLSTGDLNADGFEDVFIASSMNYPFRYGFNSLLLNDRGKRFVDLALPLGVEPRAGDRFFKPWFELDCDALDLAHPLCEGRSGRLVVTGTLGTRSSALFDLDGDGDLDIVTSEFNAEPQIMVSSLAQNGEVHWLEIALEGRESNRDGLGARVTVHLENRTLTRFHDGKSGYLAQSSMPLHFGLGEASSVSRIEIQWPSGVNQTVAGPVAANRRLVITETSDPD
jgi:hypothetical protein